MEKEKLRKEYLEKRKKLTADFIEEKSLIIQEKFLNSELYRASENICCYIDFRNEVKTDMLIQKALEDEKNVYIPKIFSDNTMEFFQIDFKTEYYKNKFNIKEPKNLTRKFQNSDFPSVFIVPGVVFSKENYRIGYGGGYYDRWIEKYPNNIYIGLAFDMQVIENFSINKYDQKLNYIITNS